MTGRPQLRLTRGRFTAGALLFLAALTLAGAAHAQAPAEPPDTTIRRPGPKKKPPPVNINVVVGLENATRSGRVVPVRVILDNGDKPITGVLQLQGFRPTGEVTEGGPPPTRSQVTEMPVDLPRKAHKEYTLYASLSPDNSDAGLTRVDWGEVRVVSGNQVLNHVPITPKAAEEQTLVLSCTGDDSGLQFLNGARPDEYTQAQKHFRAVNVSPQDLPRQWPGYEPADVVALNGRAWTLMDADQRRALRVWVERGGHAVLCAESTSEWTDPDGQAVAGVLPKVLAPETSPDCLTTWGHARYHTQSGTLLTVSGPLNPGGEVTFRQGDRPLVVTRDALRGRVVWIGFDGFRQTLRDWDGYPRFWQEALDWARKPGGSHAPPSVESIAQARAAAGALPRLPVPPMPVIIGFGVAYALIFGPLNVWMLRRLRRTVRSWLFMPGLALGMTVLVLFIGQLWGNARTVINTVSVLYASSGGRTADEQGLTGLFSPTNRSFDLAMDDPAGQLQDLPGPDTPEMAAGPAVPAPPVTYPGAPPSPAPVQPAGPLATSSFGWPGRQEEGVVRWDAQAMQLYSTRLLRSSRPRDLTGSIDVRAPAGKTDGSVRNGSNLTLHRAYLLRGKERCYLGDIAAGATCPVPARGWKRDLPPDKDEGPSGALLENQRFRKSLNGLWAQAGDLLVPQQDRKDVWLVAECRDYRCGLEVSGAPYSNGAALLLVHLPQGSGTG